MSFAVNLGQLARAVKISNKGAKAAFYHDQSFDESSLLNSFHLDKLDCPIPVPITLEVVDICIKHSCSFTLLKLMFQCSQNFKKLKAISEPVLSGKGFNKRLDAALVDAGQIDVNKMTTSPADFFQNSLTQLASSAVSHLGFPTQVMSVEARMDKLLLYEVGCHHSSPFDQDMRPGTTN